MKLFDDLYAGAMWDVGVAINRSNSLPLDKYAIFPSKALADAYASHNATAIRDQLIVEGLLDKAGDKVADDLVKAKFNNNSYAGQIVAVVTESATTVYYIGADNLLHEVGAKIDVNEEIKVDDVTIKKDEDGTLYAVIPEGLTEEDVLGLIAASKHASAMVVDSVNLETDKYTVNEVEYDAVANVIYYVKDAAAAGEDVYKEYLLIGEELTLIGSTSTDLSNYYTKSEVDDLIKDFITADDLPEIPGITVTGNKDNAEDGEVMLLADITVDETDKHKLNRTYAAAATKEYVDDVISKLPTIPGITLTEDPNTEVDVNKKTVEVVSIEGLNAVGHEIGYNKVAVATEKAVDDLADRISTLEATKIVINDEENAPVSNDNEIAVIVDATADGHTITLDYDLAAKKSYVDSEITRAIGLIPTIPDLTLAEVEAPKAEEGEVVLLSGLSVAGHEITPSYDKAATKASVDALDERVDVLEGLKIDETYAKIGDSYTKEESDGKYALKTDIPEIPELSLVEDKTISDVKIDIGTEEEPNVVDGLVTVLRKVDVNGHTLTETRVALPTVAYIEDMIADVTGGESAGEVLAQLNTFKGEVASTYATKAELQAHEENADKTYAKKDELGDLALVDSVNKITDNYAEAEVGMFNFEVPNYENPEGNPSTYTAYGLKITEGGNDAIVFGDQGEVTIYHQQAADGDRTTVKQGTIALVDDVYDALNEAKSYTDEAVANATVKWTEM